MFETRGTLLSTRVRASSSVRVPSTASRDMTSLSPRRRDARHSTLAQVLERKARKAAQHVVARSGPKGVEDLANFDDEGNEIVDEDAPTSDFAGQFFGTYLQLGVWVTILTFAGFTGFKAILENPNAAQDVGLLVAPSSAAVLLIVSFMTYTFVIKKEK
ncbi:hypothetical protein HOP50_08g52900 [Chloropicon primus]|uniref:Uncharacterized protein n=1 Tax=Chloropicon primus TaxID=1764295 RepID=A0A5B8MTK7_9CHLO|nr:hypothetical protein A3770_08p52600 [Chloropicon primus]UPR01966.1 hypothetical protein HOP50_08g52900 [Chloropicon primus]|mmetsp:Transcript_13700/g.38603  ORF Transcript_13700/g.38603 Transcript_13700/m.38603 type:complete len:159 (-) Transcript_13700:636-1112(-)|eukprot:QDZ22742.1 hypothetical protein A3770_08p52600 [Chloropicon primus]